MKQQYGQILQYVAMAVFFVCALGVTLAEGFWLARKHWGSQAKTITFAFLTNFVGVAIGGVIMGIAFLIALMMAFEPLAKDPKRQDYVSGGLLLGGALLGLIILALTKRLFVRIFGMQSGKAAWVFSIVSAITVIFVAVVIPSLFAFGLTYLKF